MMAQEDLWVYETLLKVVRNTNNVAPETNAKNATRSQRTYLKPPSHKLARIKEILAMNIGKDAAESWAKSEKAAFTLPGEASGGTAAQTNAPAQPSTAAQPGAAPHNTAGAAALAGRYVDDKGIPLPESAPQPYGEFRMMPIDLKVVIEQRDIPRLLAECANSAMRIDVRALRVLAEDPPPVDLASGTTAGSSSKEPGPGTHGGMGHEPGSPGGEPESEAESADPICPPVPVEVQGTIYIYNPPNQDVAKAEAENGQTAPVAPTAPAPGPASKASAAGPTIPQAKSSGGRP
jgi:hypothetical protein